MARTSTAKKAPAVSRAKVAAPAHTDRFRHSPLPDEGGCVTSDALTGLMWSHTILGRSVQHAGAQGLVDELNARKFAGHDDWRLPTVEELFLIADRTNVRPAIDQDVFPDTKSDWYWTASSCAGDPGYAWVVGFGYGGANWYGRNGGAFVRAVRGSSARASQ